jgi:H+/gluconate symporter-like permease
MNDLWPGICAALALAALLLLIIRFHVHAFIVLLVVSLGLGLAAGLPPDRVVDAITRGVGAILRDVALLLALGSMLGRMLEASGAAELIARRLIAVCGEKSTSLALLLAAFLIGIPIMFNVGFLLLLPIVYRLQRQTGRSLLWYLIPMTFGLSLTHSLVPPHPGVVGAVQTLAPTAAKRVMVETIVFGSLLSLPVALVGWFGPGRWWASRQFVAAPAELSAPPATDDPKEPKASSLTLALAIVLAPLSLSLLGFGGDVLSRMDMLPAWTTAPPFDPDALPAALALLRHPPLDWLRFLGKPTIALFVPTALAFWLYGTRRGWDQKRLAKLTTDALQDVGGMLFLFGAAGGFKEVIQATGVGGYLALQMRQLPLTPVAVAFVVAALVRIALGSATASILTASALLAGLAAELPGQETLLVLAVACGVTVMTQPADSGFWMIKEYGNLSVRDVLTRFNACRIFMSLVLLGLLLAYETLFVRA